MAQPKVQDIIALHDDVLLSINQSANMLGVSGNTVRRRVFAGDIKATYIGAKPFLTGRDLKQQISNQHPKNKYQAILRRLDNLESRVQLLELK